MYGEGVENYMNDAPEDVGIQKQLSNTIAPVKGVRPSGDRCHRVSRPLSGTRKFTTAIGYSMVDIDNSDAAGVRRVPPRPVRVRQPPVLPGVRRHHGRRVPVGQPPRISPNGFKADIFKVQFSFKYAFSKTY